MDDTSVQVLFQKKQTFLHIDTKVPSYAFNIEIYKINIRHLELDHQNSVIQ